MDKKTFCSGCVYILPSFLPFLLDEGTRHFSATQRSFAKRTGILNENSINRTIFTLLHTQVMNEQLLIFCYRIWPVKFEVGSAFE